MNELEKALEKYLLELPQSFQQAIKETPWKQVVNKIGLSKNLSTEQMITLESETLMVLYGIEDASGYAQNLKQEMSVEDSVAQDIVNDITNEIFVVIENKANDLESKERSDATIIITKETKKEVMQNLAQRVSDARQGNGTSISQYRSKNLPMVEEGEKVHDVTPLKKEEKVAMPPPVPSEAPSLTVKDAPKEPVATPAPLESQPLKSAAPEIAEKPAENTVEAGFKPEARYPGGLDPYREPLI